MIGRLRGTLLEKQAPVIVLDVGGVGYKLLAPMTTFYQLPDIGKDVSLYTHLVVREDSMSLYGFMQKQELNLFQTLIKISGVGPKLALTVLSGIDPNAFVEYIIDGDTTNLARLPGIGKKTAQRLVVEMRDKLKDWEITGGTKIGTFSVKNTPIQDSISALVALGYKPQDANKVVAKYKDKDLPSEEIIRLALKDMSK